MLGNQTNLIPMKKIAFISVLLILSTTLSGCDLFGGSSDPETFDPAAPHDPYTLENFDEEAETLSELNQEWHLAKMEMLMALQDEEPLEKAFEKREEVKEILAEIESTINKMKTIHTEVYENASAKNETPIETSNLPTAFAEGLNTGLPSMGVLDSVMDFFSGGSFRAADEAMRIAIYTGYHDLVNQYGDEAANMLNTAFEKAGIDNVEDVLYCSSESMKTFWDERYTLDEGFAERIDWHYTDANDALQKDSREDLEAFINNLTGEIINEEMEAGQYAEYLPRHLADFVIRNVGYNDFQKMIDNRRETLLRIKNEELAAQAAAKEAAENEINLTIQGIYDQQELTDTVENENYYTEGNDPEDNTEVVIAVNEGTGEVVIQTVNTNDTNAVALPPGDYTVVATTDGNAPAQVDNVNITTGQTTIVHNTTYNPQTATPGLWNLVTNGGYQPPQVQVQIPTITDIHDLNIQLDIQVQLQTQMEHHLEILRSMQGGMFTTVSMSARTDLNNKLSQANKEIAKLQKEIADAKELRAANNPDGDNDDSDDDDDDDDDDNPYSEPTTLQAYGTWENGQESGAINLSFSSHGGPVTGTFSNCIAGECWNSKATGSFTGGTNGTVSGSISGSGGGSYQSFDGSTYYISYSITGSFSGAVYLDRDFGEGTFSTSVHLDGETYNESGTWTIAF